MNQHDYYLNMWREVEALATKKADSTINAFQHLLEDIQQTAIQPQKNLFPPTDVQKNETSSNKPHQHIKKETKHTIIKNENIQQSFFVDIPSLKVKELKAELRKRGLAIIGLKKDLQRRLKKAIENEVKNNVEDNASESIVENQETYPHERHLISATSIELKVESYLVDDKLSTMDISTNEISNINEIRDKGEIITKEEPEENGETLNGMEVEIKDEDKNHENEARISETAKESALNGYRLSKERMSMEIINEKLDNVQVSSDENESKVRQSIEIDTVLSFEPSEKLPENENLVFLPSSDMMKEQNDSIVDEMEDESHEDNKDCEFESNAFIESKTEESSKDNESPREEVWMCTINEDEKLHSSGESEVKSTKNHEAVTSIKPKINGMSKLDSVYTSAKIGVDSSGLKSQNKGIAPMDLTIPSFKAISAASCGSKSISSASTITSSSSQASLKKEKFAAARKARLEEMRGQSKKVALSSAVSKANMTSYKFNKISSIKFTEPLGGKPERIPQVAVAPPAASNTKLASQTKDREEMRKKVAAQMREKVKPLKFATPNSKTTCQETPSRSKVKWLEEVSILNPTKLEPHEMSPMDTYEISSNDSSSSDDSDYSSDDDKPQKRKPAWAQGENLKAALTAQICDPNKLDPDRIFGEVTSCNLEEIFETKKSKYRKRASSGNWTRDHITLEEKINYKKEMGYQAC